MNWKFDLPPDCVEHFQNKEFILGFYSLNENDTYTGGIGKYLIDPKNKNFKEIKYT